MQDKAPSNSPSTDFISVPRVAIEEAITAMKSSQSALTDAILISSLHKTPPRVAKSIA